MENLEVKCQCAEDHFLDGERQIRASSAEGVFADTNLPADRSQCLAPDIADTGSGIQSSNSKEENRNKAASVSEWKAQALQTQKHAAVSTRERLREEYAKLAKALSVGDRCVVGGNRGVIAFLGDEVEGLPGGFWVGVRYDEPVGKNDGRVKGVLLFECQTNYGHVVRPDKVIVVDQSTPPRSLGGARGSSSSPLRPKRQGHNARPMSASPHVKRPTSPSPPPPHSRRANTTSPPLSKPAASCWKDLADVIGSDPSVEETMPRHRVGLVYDSRMELHECSGRDHPEKPARISTIFSTLASRNLAQRCVRVPARAATAGELRSVHTAEHIQRMQGAQAMPQTDLDAMAATLNSVFLCPASAACALLAAGSVVEATKRVCGGELGKAVCVVRPPGHHALPGCAMGFCLFANVAVAASEARRRGWASRVLIVDWDVHLGNGTQAMFLSDPTVLVCSVHRYDNGSFYPGGPDGNMDAVGRGEGEGFNVNVPWPRGGAGDADYRLVFDTLLLPIAREFKPDLVLVSAGFDAAAGDPLGGCKVSPGGFAMMTRALRELAGGRLVLALEGGYSLRATAESLAACVSALIDDDSEDTNDAPALFPDTVREVAAVHAKYWKCCGWAASQDGQAASKATGRGGQQRDDDVEAAREQMRGMAVASPPNSCAAVRASSCSSDSSSDEGWMQWLSRGSSPSRISPPDNKKDDAGRGDRGIGDDDDGE